MIGPDMSSGIIRWIYEYTPGELEPFVRRGSLNQDCVAVFNELIDEQKNSTIKKLKQRELN
jgi:hypothetical protein